MNKLKLFIRNIFIPHPGNNYRSKALHIDSLTYYLLFFLLLTFTFKLFYLKTGEVLGFATDITVDKLYLLTNEVRQKKQLAPLAYNVKLAVAAQKKAQDILSKNYWSHYGPDGATPWDFILSSGYAYEYAAENLAKNFLFSDGVIQAWMNSPSHRENILRQEYSDVGFATANGILNGEETTVIVQMLGKPQSSAIAKQPEINSVAVEARSTTVDQNPTVGRQPVIMSQKTKQPNKNISLFAFNSSLIFLAFLFLALILDLHFVNKLRIVRITGKNLAHLIFIGFIFLGLLSIIKGSIL